MEVAEERGESRPMAGERRTEQTIGLVILAILAIGCVLVLRPFFTAICFALILVIATYPAFQRLERAFGGRRTSAALIMTLLAGLLLVLPPLAIAPNVQGHVASAVQAVRHILENGVPSAARLGRGGVADRPPAARTVAEPRCRRWRGDRSSARRARLVQALAHRGGPEPGRHGRSAGSGARDLVLPLSRRRGRGAGTDCRGASDCRRPRPASLARRQGDDPRGRVRRARHLAPASSAADARASGSRASRRRCSSAW